MTYHGEYWIFNIKHGNSVLVPRPTSPIEFYADGHSKEDDVWSARAWLSHSLKIGKRCWSDVSAVNRVQIGRASVGRRTGVDRWFFKSADSLKLAGNLLIMGHTSVYFEGHRAMVCPFQSVDRCPADAHDVRAGTARLPVDVSSIEKIGRASENF